MASYPQSSIKPFIKVRAGGDIDPEVDKVLTELQDNVELFAKSVGTKVSLDNQIYTGVAVTSGTTLHFNHKLGRPVVGWKIIGKSAIGDVYDTQATNPTPSQTLQLVSNATMTIALEIY